MTEEAGATTVAAPSERGGIVRIAQVAPLYEPVPPARYGGTERMVAYLTEELVRRSHEVTLFASGDSQTSARLVSAVARSLRTNPDVRDQLAPHVLELGQVFERAAEFDLIHCHVDYPASPSGAWSARPPFLGRMSPEKRPDLAIAKKTGLPLKIASKVGPNDRE